MDKDASCFGFFSGAWDCVEKCKAQAQCKALVNSDGLEVVAAVLDDLIEELPNQTYISMSSIRGTLAQILNPNLVDKLLIDSKNAAENPDPNIGNLASLIDPL